MIPSGQQEAADHHADGQRRDDDKRQNNAVSRRVVIFLGKMRVPLGTGWWTDCLTANLDHPEFLTLVAFTRTARLSSWRFRTAVLGLAKSYGI